MSYRDDFYIVDNIIGCTGKIEWFPTVYFRCGDEQGHITQSHDDSQNVGRHEVRKDPSHELFNVETIDPETKEKVTKMVEKRKGKIVHTSRSVFKSVQELTGDELAVLAQAIWRYTGEKYITGFSARINRDIKKTKENKSLLLKELLNR